MACGGGRRGSACDRLNASRLVLDAQEQNASCRDDPKLVPIQSPQDITEPLVYREPS